MGSTLDACRMQACMLDSRWSKWVSRLQHALRSGRCFSASLDADTFALVQAFAMAAFTILTFAAWANAFNVKSAVIPFDSDASVFACGGAPLRPGGPNRAPIGMPGLVITLANQPSAASRALPRR